MTKTLEEEIKFREQLLFFISLMANESNFMEIDYVQMWKEFNKLENSLGIKLSIFHQPEFLSDEKKNKLKLYSLKNNTISLTDLKNFVQGFNNLAEYSEPQKNIDNMKITELIKITVTKLIKLPDSKLIELYLSYFDLFLTHIIEPTVDIIGPEVSQRSFRHGYQKQIDIFKGYIERNSIDLNIFVLHLDGSLRNALVHNNYYIDNKELYYFQYNPKTNYFKEIVISQKEFIEMVISTIPLKLFLSILMGLKNINIDMEQFLVSARRNRYR